ncbi:MBL fold metallo-hydrolase [Stigmatella aurantiaca]|uniref:cAMP phosphodiesterases class-II n=1 Tax=Stigmatella aurantiaca (strain DW4/3-1) TaxID=378806 RepID=Q08ZV0_STIAD|nr:3',5'-cyclic-nucleotide phosphodiesterase [Stigmatella aurantiaca]ADO71245.1 cAMP phosphodiesterases class-II [Stigmatella aurantiaca DW4/3-1]EAU66046.1 cAMP phosphodiesterases class-II:Metallo-beta-lactamase superfamily [Stigmatella aurantiaca DW4/3-1]
MKLKVLGCHGGELPSCRTTCFLLDEVLALDAGALTSTLSLEQLCKVDDILIGHSHFDHTKDLPLLADLVIGRRDSPVTIHASRECARALRTSMFNNELWPDFTRIPTRKAPVLRIKSFRAGSTFQIGPYTVQSVPVSHPVESCGFIISRGKTALAMSGDTGPTDRLWKALNQAKNLKALLVETSFPNALQQLADLSGHLTPRTLQSELAKFNRNGTEVLLYHLKPAFVSQLKRELAGLPVEILELGDSFEF